MVSTLLVTTLVHNKTNERGKLVSEIDNINMALECSPGMEMCGRGDGWKHSIYKEAIEFTTLLLEEGVVGNFPMDFYRRFKGFITPDVERGDCDFSALVQRIQGDLTSSLIRITIHNSAAIRGKRDRVVNILSSWGKVCSHCGRKDKCDCHLGPGPSFLADCNIQAECRVGCSVAGYPASLARNIASFEQILVNTNNSERGDLEKISEIEDTLNCPNATKKCPLQPTGWEQLVAAAALEFAQMATQERILEKLPGFSFTNLIDRIASLGGKPAIIFDRWEVKKKRCGPSSFIRLLKADILPALKEVEKDRANSWLYGVYTRKLQTLSTVFQRALGAWGRYCTSCLLHNKCLCNEPTFPHYYVDCFNNYDDTEDDEDYLEFYDSGSGDGA